jgi:glutathione S-transferase
MTAKLTHVLPYLSYTTTTMSKPAITLYSTATPNGICASILLEALKAAYPDNADLTSYETIKMSIRDADIGQVHNQVKSPWFLEINPNGRIPAVTVNGFNVFETSAIILYLAQVYDTQKLFSYDPVNEAKEYSKMLQWIFFAVSDVWPKSELVIEAIIVCIARWNWSNARTGQPFYLRCS